MDITEPAKQNWVSNATQYWNLTPTMPIGTFILPGITPTSPNPTANNIFPRPGFVVPTIQLPVFQKPHIDTNYFLIPERVVELERVLNQRNITPGRYRIVLLDGTLIVEVLGREWDGSSIYVGVYLDHVYYAPEGMLIDPKDSWKDWPVQGQGKVPQCRHEYVNVGFTSIRMVCRFCDVERGSDVEQV